VVLLDVPLEVVGVGDRSETRRQSGEGGDGHVVDVVSDLDDTFILRGATTWDLGWRSWLGTGPSGWP
jgi:hypothetical protein